MVQKGPHAAPTTIPVVQFYSTWYFQDLSARSCLSFPLITEELEVSTSQRYFFDVLLTMHLSIILVINQLNAQILVL